MQMIASTASAVLLVLGGLVPAFASDPATEPGQAKAWAHDDPDLAWEPCPEFLPEGCVSALLNGDPAADSADVFLKLPAGASIPRHRHTAAERMTLVAGTLRLDYDGHEPVELTPGTYAYGPAGLPHEGECAADTECVLFIAFDGPVDAFEVGPGEPPAGL